MSRTGKELLKRLLGNVTLMIGLLSHLMLTVLLLLNYQVEIYLTLPIVLYEMAAVMMITGRYWTQIPKGYTGTRVFAIIIVFMAAIVGFIYLIFIFNVIVNVIPKTIIMALLASATAIDIYMYIMIMNTLGGAISAFEFVALVSNIYPVQYAHDITIFSLFIFIITRTIWILKVDLQEEPEVVSTPPPDPTTVLSA